MNIVYVSIDQFETLVQNNPQEFLYFNVGIPVEIMDQLQDKPRILFLKNVNTLYVEVE